jgi:predicted RNA binding protein YcfA (HicA-like mRNA interferase family)
MKLSRDESGASLIKSLSKIGYEVTRQKGTTYGLHVRMKKVRTISQYPIIIQ